MACTTVLVEHMNKQFGMGIVERAKQRRHGLQRFVERVADGSAAGLDRPNRGINFVRYVGHNLAERGHFFGLNHLRLRSTQIVQRLRGLLLRRLGVLARLLGLFKSLLQIKGALLYAHLKFTLRGFKAGHQPVLRLECHLLCGVFFAAHFVKAVGQGKGHQDHLEG